MVCTLYTTVCPSQFTFLNSNSKVLFCCSKLPDTMEEALNLGKKSTTAAAKQGSVNRAMEDEEG